MYGIFIFKIKQIFEISHWQIISNFVYLSSQTVYIQIMNRKTVIMRKKFLICTFIIIINNSSRFLCNLLILFYFILFFFNCYLAVPRPALSHSRGDSLTNPMLITAFCTSSTRRSPGALWWGWVPKPGRAPSGVWTGNLLVLIPMP